MEDGKSGLVEWRLSNAPVFRYLSISEGLIFEI